MEKLLETEIKNTVHGLETFDIAQVLYNTYKESVRCVKITPRACWEIHRDGDWMSLDDAVELRLCISRDIPKVIIKLATFHGNESNQAGDYHDERRRMYMKLLTRCKNRAFKNNVIKDCAELFYVTLMEESDESE